MGTDQHLDPADAPSIPPTFMREPPPPAEDATSITLPPPELPTLIPSDPRQAAVAQEEPPATPSSLSQRARRPMTVQEALAAATPVPAPRTSKPRSPAETAVSATIAALFPAATVRQVKRVTDGRVFKALWQAHRVRAQSDGDHGLAVSASVLLDAVRRLPEGALQAATVDLDGEILVAWVDVGSQTVLALTPSEFLAGL